MKIKKVLCLGAVLGAVLSVGMVVSAFALDEISLTETSQPNFIELPLKAGEGGLGVNSGSNLTGDHPLGYLHYNNLKVENQDVKLDQDDSALTFTVGSDGCFITVIMRGDQTGGGILAKTGGDETPIPEKDNFIKKLDAGEYTIKKSADGAPVIEEIEFTGYNPQIIVVSGAKGDANQDEGSAPIAVFKKSDGSAYYAAVLITKGHINSKNPQITIKSDDGTTDSKPITEVYKGIENDCGTYKEEYDANYFGLKADYIGVIKLTDGNNDSTLATNESQIHDKLKIDKLQTS